MELLNKLIDFDIRRDIFRNVTRFVDYELIEGDIFEFGVYTGRSLALLSHFHQLNKQSIHKIPFERKIVGFDSFNGLPCTDGHPRWQTELFSINHSYHPICKLGEKVTPSVVYELFEKCELPKPFIEHEDFNHTLKPTYQKSAIIHIDCDVYQSTKDVLIKMEPTFQEGTIILFDDWFNFKANPNKGEQRAFKEFVNITKWKFIEYQTYATFGKSFIVTYEN